MPSLGHAAANIHRLRHRRKHRDQRLAAHRYRPAAQAAVVDVHGPAIDTNVEPAGAFVQNDSPKQDILSASGELFASQPSRLVGRQSLSRHTGESGLGLRLERLCYGREPICVKRGEVCSERRRRVP